MTKIINNELKIWKNRPIQTTDEKWIYFIPIVFLYMILIRFNNFVQQPSYNYLEMMFLFSFFSATAIPAMLVFFKIRITKEIRLAEPAREKAKKEAK